MIIADHETAVDFLNYEAISDTVVALLRDSRERAVTVGIHGDWGAGKSSVLKMIEAEIIKDKQISCLWFNGWAFEGFEETKTALLESTVNELCRQKSNIGKVKSLGAKLMKRVHWLKAAQLGANFTFNLATGMPSPDQVTKALNGLQTLTDGGEGASSRDILTGITEISSFLKSDENSAASEQIYRFREEFRDLLDEAKIDQMVILIDDLDRCLPKTAINTLEAIRLFLFVPKTAFIIGADEAMIEYAVRQHFPDLPPTSGPIPYAKSYLEKLVQVPFRLPALGIQETKVYVTLLLVERLVGQNDNGFQPLLDKARDILNRPWLGGNLSSEDVRGVNQKLQKELEQALVLAQQIGPVLAEGVRGNPRQIKRFLNTLLARQAMASARGFGDDINQPILAKLMLAERFQPDFYEYISNKSMVAGDGKVPDISILEKFEDGGSEEPAKKQKQAKNVEPYADVEDEVKKWLENEWLQRWLTIEPCLGEVDLRPYIFVASDKRLLSGAVKSGGPEALIEQLSGTKMAVRTVESEVKNLTSIEADHIFSALREKIVRQGNFISEPTGFSGARIVAKHHPRFQSELLAILGGLDAKALGPWVVVGWNEILSEESAKQNLRELLTGWANQEDNPNLKRASGMALSRENRET